MKAWGRLGWPAFFFLASWLCLRAGSPGESIFLAAWADESPRYQFLPWLERARRQFHQGFFPLWDSLAGPGAPLAAGWQSAPWSFWRWPYLLMGGVSHLDAMVVARGAVGAVSTMGLLRRLGHGRPAAFWAGLAFLFQPYFIKWPNMPYWDSHALLPGFCWALAGLSKRRRSIDALCGIGFLVGILSGGHPEAIFLDLCFGFSFWMLGAPSGPSPLSAAHRLGVFAALCGLAAGAAAPAWLPFLEYWPQAWSYHQAGVGFFGFPWSEAPAFFLPGYAGDLATQVFEGRDLPPGLGVMLGGLMGLSLAALSLLPRHSAFGALYAVVGIGLAFSLVPFRPVAALPGFSHGYLFRYGLAGIMLGLLLATAPLLEIGRADRRRRGVWKAVAAAVAAMTAGAAWAHPPTRISAVFWLGEAALLVFLGWNLGHPTARRRRWIPVLATAALLATAAQTRRLTPPIERTNFLSLVQTPPPAIPAPLPDRPAPRLMADRPLYPAGWNYGWGIDDLRINSPLAPRRYVDRLRRIGRESPTEFERRFAEGFSVAPRLDDGCPAVLARLGVQGVWTMDWPATATPLPPAGADGVPIGHRLHHLDGLIVSAHPAAPESRVEIVPPRPGWVSLTASQLPGADQPASGRWFAAVAGGKAHYFEFRDPDRNPADRRPHRFHFPAAAKAPIALINFADPDAIPTQPLWADPMLRAGPPPTAAKAIAPFGYWYAIPDAVPPAYWAQSEGDPRAAVIESRDERVTVETAGRSGRLVLTDLAFPGWKARAAGSERPIEVEDGLWRAVRVPPGSPRVEFFYQPWSFRAALWWTLGTSALILLRMSGSALRLWRRRER